MKKTLTTLPAAFLCAASFAQIKVSVHEDAADQPVTPKEI